MNVPTGSGPTPPPQGQMMPPAFQQGVSQPYFQNPPYGGHGYQNGSGGYQQNGYNGFKGRKNFGSSYGNSNWVDPSMLAAFAEKEEKKKNLLFAKGIAKVVKKQLERDDDTSDSSDSSSTTSVSSPEEKMKKKKMKSKKAMEKNVTRKLTQKLRKAQAKATPAPAAVPAPPPPAAVDVKSVVEAVVTAITPMMKAAVSEAVQRSPPRVNYVAVKKKMANSKPMQKKYNFTSIYDSEEKSETSSEAPSPPKARSTPSKPKSKLTEAVGSAEDEEQRPPIPSQMILDKMSATKLKKLCGAYGVAFESAADAKIALKELRGEKGTK